MKKTKKASYKFDDSFYRLAKDTDTLIKSVKTDLTQEEQVNNLLKYEDLFKKEVCKYTQSSEIYKSFLIFIIADKGNILSARPFFREKSDSFNKNLSPAFKSGDFEELKNHSINFNMVTFIRNNWKGTFPKRAELYYEEIVKHRNILIELNLPLAINRAKLFYRKVPKSNVTLLDMINLCVQGLCVGVDKWSGPYKEVFRSVCIGRMTASLIDAYSQTSVHFTPDDAKILYRANSFKSRHSIKDIDQLTELINETLKRETKNNKKSRVISSDDLRRILHAASPSTSEVLGGEDGVVYDSFDFTPSPEKTQEESLIENDILDRSHFLINGMDLVTIKVLRLKGMYT